MAEEFKAHQGTERVSIIGEVNKITKEVVSYRLKISFKEIQEDNDEEQLDIKALSPKTPAMSQDSI